MHGSNSTERWVNMTIDDERPFTEDMKRIVAEQKLAFVGTVQRLVFHQSSPKPDEFRFHRHGS